MRGRLSLARGALIGLTLGDALGMPVQDYSREQVAEFFDGAFNFRAARNDHPYAHGLGSARITDDSEQTFLIADLLIKSRGQIDSAKIAVALNRWESEQVRRGSSDLLGPSTKRALVALRSGVPIEKTGLQGTTNGAAMRIAPVGIAIDASNSPARLIEGVRKVGLVTHNTGIANAGATLVASLISRVLDGVSPLDALAAACHDADLAQTYGNQTEHELLSDTVWRALKSNVTSLPNDAETSSSIPAAIFCVFANLDSPWNAIVQAVSLGGDTDTIASIAGGIAGAIHGYDAWPDDCVEQVVRTNALEIDRYAIELLELRDRVN